MDTSKTLGNNMIRTEPKDSFKIAYIIHFFLGVGNLLPWNTYITAIDYFGFLYPNKNVENVFCVAYMSSSMIVLIVMLSWGSKFSRKINFRFQMNIGLSMFIFSLIITPTLDWACRSNSQLEDRFNVTVASMVICGLGDGIVAGTLVGSAGKFPKQYMQAIFAGHASSGVLVTILRILTKVSLPHTVKGLKTSAHLYFIVCEVILIACMVSCNLLHKLPVMKQYNYILQQEDPLRNRKTKKFWEVARTIQWPAFGVLMIYIVTLSIFPGFLAENVESILLKDWYPILLIGIYNGSDLLGKSVTAIYMVKGTRNVTCGCLFRVLLYPLFRACLHGPKWLKTEFPMALLTSILGLSNGYLTCCLMILAPKEVESSEAEIAAIVMVVFLGLGLVGGSVLGWFWLI